MGRPAPTPAEHEMNLTMKTTRVNCLWTTLPLRKLITSGTPELLAGKHINYNSISSTVHHHQHQQQHHFRLLLSVDMRNLIYMSRQYRLRYNKKYQYQHTVNNSNEQWVTLLSSTLTFR